MQENKTCYIAIQVQENIGYSILSFHIKGHGNGYGYDINSLLSVLDGQITATILQNKDNNYRDNNNDSYCNN